MSWQAYVDTHLIGTGNVKQACILGHDGSVWATSPGFGPQGTEGTTVARLFENPSDSFGNGITFNGMKYFALRADDRSIYGKKENSGIVCARTKQCVLVGVYDENIQPGNCTVTVEKLADYLIENGY